MSTGGSSGSSSSSSVASLSTPLSSLTFSANKKKKRDSAHKLLTCGLISGLLQAGVFNPWDRALYLSVMNTRNFLDIRNFYHPMTGVTQTIAQRAISAGLYFPLEELFREVLTDYFPKDSKIPLSLITFLGGILAGAVNGFVMNPVSAIKYNYWGQSECGKESFFTTAKSMLKKGGTRPFFVGATATISRDLIFGGVFAFLRHEMLASSFNKNLSISSNVNGNINNNGNNNYNNSNSESESESEIDRRERVRSTGFMVNVLSASIATIASSPFNYIRNVHYATPPEVKPDDGIKILKELWKSAADEKTFFLRFKYLQSRLRIGWGTARVGCGMAFGAWIYNVCSERLL